MDKELKRLKNLKDYDILDTETNDTDYTSIVELISKICKFPIVLISIIDLDRQWFKAKIGLDTIESFSTKQFCINTIESDEDIFIVESAKNDNRFCNNSFVIGNPNIHFYAGISLKCKNGYSLGTLCVVDFIPRKLENNDILLLKYMAKQISNLFELKLLNKTTQLNNQLKSNNISTFINELRKPLNSIISADILKNHNEKKNIEIISNSGKDLLHIINKMEHENNCNNTCKSHFNSQKQQRIKIYGKCSYKT